MYKPDQMLQCEKMEEHMLQNTDGYLIGNYICYIYFNI